MVFECRRCGSCCRRRSINVSRSDIVRWWATGRYDVLREVSWVDNRQMKGRQGTGGFFVAGSLNPRLPCPFLLLEKGLCGIYDTRPRACRDAPYGYDEFPECPAFDRADISWLKRTMTQAWQENDAKRAFMHQGELYGLLVEARKRFDLAKAASVARAERNG